MNNSRELSMKGVTGQICPGQINGVLLAIVVGIVKVIVGNKGM